MIEYNIQKTRFSSLQSEYHKMLNELRDNSVNINKDRLRQLIAINETMDLLESQVIDFNENNCNVSKEQLENIEKNNNTINFLKQFAILHRFLQDS
jgi:hypothetical protein